MSERENQYNKNSVKHLGDQECKACQGISSKMKDELLSCCIWLVCSQTNKMGQCLKEFFGFWRKCIPHLGVLLLPTYQVLWKAASFEWVQNDQRLCTKSKLLYELLCHWGHDGTDPIMTEDVSGRKGCCWVLWQVPICQSYTAQALRIVSRQPSQISTLLWELALDLLLSLSRD